MTAPDPGWRIPAADGGTLAADLLLPGGTAPTPAIVCLMPYRRDAVGGAGMWPTLSWFAARGYACVLVDPRGMGSSDGPARAPFDPAEGDDGVAAVRWAAAQRWCTGSVGLWGFSYGALLALRTAARGAPGLRAVVAVMPMLDPERDFVHPGGAAGCLTAQGMWGLSTLGDLLLPPIGAYHDAAESRRWRDRVEQAEPYLLDLYRHPPGHAAWRARAFDASAVTTPVLCVGGLRDMFCDATVRLYEQLAGPRKLLLGPWSHAVPPGAASLARRWWDRWLGDDYNGVEDDPPVTVYVQNGEWLDLDTWPSSGGSAAVGDGVGRPGDPIVGPLSGLWGIPSGSGEPLDQHDDDMRSLTFTGAPDDEPVLLIGRPSVAVSGSPGRLVVKLTDVDPRGRSTLITGGIRGDGAGPVVLDPTAYQLPAGHRVRVVVGDAAFPRLWPSREVLGGIGDVELSLPVVEAGLGKPAPVPWAEPEPEPDGPWLHHTPLWRIERQPGRGRVAVVLGDSYAVRLPSDGTVVETETRLTSTVHMGGSACVDGVSTTTARLRTGETIVVEVRLRLSSDSAQAWGRVGVDGATLVDRTWRS